MTTVYRSASVHPRFTWANRFATVVASVLLVVGAVAMIIGLVGASGMADLGVARTALYIGLGLVASGSGGLLLLVLRIAR